MRKLLTIFLILALSTPALAAPPDTKKLRQGIEAVLALKDVAGSKVGIYVADARTGEELYSLNADELFNPASNTKLVTAATVLDQLGPAFTWTTRLSHEGSLTQGSVDAIWLKSDGDPFLVYEDIMRLALAAKRAGVQEVKGDVFVDDLSFAPGYMPPGFDQKDEDASYRAPIGAVSVNFNAIAVAVKAGKDGVEVDLYPPNDYVIVKNSAKLANGKAQRINVRSITDGERTRIEVTGTLGKDAAALEVRKRIDHPGLYAASIMRQALVDLGIKVNGTFKVGERPDKTTTIIVEASEPLTWSLSGMNKWSNNFIAEQVFRSVGGEEVVKTTLKKLGVPEGWKIMNGSGLYDGNLFTPRQLGVLLVAMEKHRYAPEFVASLAIAGADGTMASRLKTKDLRGKTGTLNEVSALSGYTTTASGRHVSYVILFNDTPVRAWTLRDEQDKIAAAISDWSE